MSATPESISKAICPAAGCAGRASRRGSSIRSAAMSSPPSRPRASISRRARLTPASKGRALCAVLSYAERAQAHRRGRRCAGRQPRALRRDRHRQFRQHQGRRGDRHRRRHRHAEILRAARRRASAMARMLLDEKPVRLAKAENYQAIHLMVPRRGVAIHINAFNFPSWGLWEKAAVALLAGVPVLAKPASATALAGARHGEGRDRRQGPAGRCAEPALRRRR